MDYERTLELWNEEEIIKKLDDLQEIAALVYKDLEYHRERDNINWGLSALEDKTAKLFKAIQHIESVWWM